MANGIDPSKGHVLVPFDLKEDVVKPLERLEDGQILLAQRFEEHLSYVNTSIKGRMEPIAKFVEDLQKTVEANKVRREKAVKVLMWIGGALGSILAALLANARFG